MLFWFYRLSPSLLQRLKHNIRAGQCHNWNSSSVTISRLLLKATNCSFARYPTWDALGSATYTPSMHTAVTTQTPAEDGGAWQSQHQMRKQNPATGTETSLAHLHLSFPICKEKLFSCCGSTFTTDTVFKRGNENSKNKQSRFPLNFPLSMITKASTSNWIRNKEVLKCCFVSPVQ